VDDAAEEGRTGWLAYLAVTRRGARRRSFTLIKVRPPDDVSSLAAAAAAAERMVTTEHRGEAHVQGLFDWEDGYLCPRWTSSVWGSGGPGERESRGS
jgi:hypothetical protein